MKTIALSPLRTLRRAFTLVEVLVVLAIIGIIMFLAVPNMGAIIGGSKLTQAADMLRYDLAIAQQTAVKENLPVEIRFYTFKDPEFLDRTKTVYTAYQIYRLLPDLERPNDRTAPRILDPVIPVKKLPPGIIIPESQRWCSLVSSDKIPRGKEEVRGLLTSEKTTEADFCSYQINADGESNLDKTGREQWYVTLIRQEDLRGSAEDLKPDNYVTLQVEPFSGAVRWFQPH